MDNKFGKISRIQACAAVRDGKTILEDVMHKSKEDLCLSAPGFDIRGIQHEKLYSRLYMS